MKAKSKSVLGRKVVNAKKKVTLTITRKDVLNGNTKDEGSCAIAQACMRQFGSPQALAFLGRTYVLRSKKWVRYLTGRTLRKEIIRFDKSGVFVPGKYTLMAITPSKSKGKRQGSAKDGQGRANRKKRARPHYVTGIRPHALGRSI